ncbi:LacI family DNA-binding transcriptional regulator [Salipaludibacillus aurantiacus]|uniref:LacI family transcriptional regulator n=1 Tax=Salipaludibacillus aurantiacus TaxID=1601833 RepID=A0A1H9UFL0_9BACI|nr:LacI family DNA-binding transcriptional regulator [Salipaludibacillus aurantiacus]SES07823.1 LacI family transcriptional regulator [Salipaludibacillus aurantiacus]
MATIKDVAKKANVSIATVSRILNHKEGYTEETRKKVLQTIEELGYHPNGVARGLISKRTNTIGVLVPSISSMIVSEMVSGIENVAHQTGTSVIVCHTESNGKKTMQYLHLLKEKQVDGIIFTSEILKNEYYEFLNKFNIPVVLLSSESINLPVPHVKVDDRLAAYHATEYLIKQGHSKIGMVSGNRQDMIAGLPRIEGFKMAMEMNQVPLSESLIVSGRGFSFKDGSEAFEKLISAHPELTAVFAASDEMALGIISKAHKMNIDIPGRLSVIGYDNLAISEMSIPPLTTVAQPMLKMGESAGEMIMNMINTGTVPENCIVSHKIVERESVKKIN